MSSCGAMYFLLAQVTDSQRETFIDLLIYQGTGLVIVLLVLGSLWAVVALLSWLMAWLQLPDPEVEQISSKTVPSRGSLTKPPIEEHPELVAVMTAAVHTVIQGPFRIVSIRDSNSSEKKHDTEE